MKVSELIQLLNLQDGDREVTMLVENSYASIQGVVVEDNIVRIHDGDLS